MTIQFYIHTIAKRAEAITLVDSGATENFMNLTYARWLKLPIHPLKKPRKIFNVDGTENKWGIEILHRPQGSNWDSKEPITLLSNGP